MISWNKFFILIVFQLQTLCAFGQLKSIGMTYQAPSEDSRGFSIDSRFRLPKGYRFIAGFQTTLFKSPVNDYRENGFLLGLKTNPFRVVSGSFDVQSAQVGSDYQKSSILLGTQLDMSKWIDGLSLDVRGGVRQWTLVEEGSVENNQRRLNGLTGSVRLTYFLTETFSFAIFTEGTQFKKTEIEQVDTTLLTDPSFGEVYSIVDQINGVEITLNTPSLSVTIGGERSVTLADDEEQRIGLFSLSWDVEKNLSFRGTITSQNSSTFGLDLRF